ncbi:MAG: hypothetical protein ASARMPRED_007960 [Alectoria sarmentosa]|nr:MAG: hypothetical protein ASARMPRED_007960 [Alectoria sarmentosa]
MRAAVSAQHNPIRLQLPIIHNNTLSPTARRDHTMERDRTMSPSFNETPTMAKSTARQSDSPIRSRLFGRASTVADMSNPLRPRRSSNFSDSVESTRQSIKSSTDNLLLPRATSPEMDTVHEPSHWHSAPLALALLPAVGGLFFPNGSAVVTDLTLLGLAAVFLNWSVRLPWDWYISAQSIQVNDTQPSNDGYASDTIIEEGSEEEEQSSLPASPLDGVHDPAPKPAQAAPIQSSATRELRIHELLALLMCFLFPAGGAWLLHHIRGQLTRPSEGLVSDYNLTIFLLAAELRPLSHLIKLVQARTLHLQRTVTTNAYSTTSSNMSSATVNDLQGRLTEIEKHIADADTNTSGTNPKSPTLDLVTQVRKTLQPDLDALNRAVRRYEKRATLLSLQTESRLQDLEKRLGDAITLAAAAERSSQSSRQRRGSGVGLVLDLFDDLAAVASLPIQICWTVVTFPWRAVASIVGAAVAGAEGWLGNKVRREMRTAGVVEKRGGSGSEKRRVQGRAGKKVM